MDTEPENMRQLIGAARDPLLIHMLPLLEGDLRDLGRLRCAARVFDRLVRGYVQSTKTLGFCAAHACGWILEQEGAQPGTLRCPRCSPAWISRTLRLSEAATTFTLKGPKGLDIIGLEEGPNARFGQILRPVAIVAYGEYVPLRVYASYARGAGGVLTRCIFPRYSLEYKLAARLDRALSENASEWAAAAGGGNRRVIISRLCSTSGSPVHDAKVPREAVIRTVNCGVPPWAPRYRPPPQPDRQLLPAEYRNRTFTLCLEILSPPGGRQTILRYVLAKGDVSKRSAL